MKRISVTAVYVAALIAAALCVPAPVQASVVPMTLTDLVTSSEAIVEVTVSGSTVHEARMSGLPSTSRSPVMTSHRLKVGRVLKGSRASDFDLELPGGSLGNATMLVPEVPQFGSGGRYLLFLDGDGVVGGPQGSLRIAGGRVPALDLSLSEATELIRTIETSIHGPYPEYDSVANVTISSLQASADVAPLGVSAAGVVSVAPNSADAGIGQTITLTGSGFGSTRGTVRFPDGSSMDGSLVSAPNIVSWTSDTIVVEVPRSAESGPIHVTTSTGIVYQSSAFTVGFSAMLLRWPTMPVYYRINENTSDMSGEGAAIRAAMTTWNEAGSDFRAEYAGTSSLSVALPPSDGRNDIGFAGSGFPAGTLAWNYLWYTSDRFVESNIIFNDAYSWVAGAASGRFDLQSAALHELGHSVGLDDQYGDVTEVMGAATDNATRRVLSAAEVRGTRWVNGADVTMIDADPAVWFDQIGDSTMLLGWHSADDASVVSYRLSESGHYLGEHASTDVAFAGLTPGATYRFSITGIDMLGTAVVSYPTFEVQMPLVAGTAAISSAAPSTTTTVPATLGLPEAPVAVAFDAVTADGSLRVTRMPTLPAALSAARAFVPGWSLSFSGTHTGSVTVTVPVDARLPEWRRAGLSAMSFEGGVWTAVPAEYDSATASVRVTLPKPMPFALTESATVDAGSALALDAAHSSLTPAYGASAVIKVRLQDIAGTPLSGRSVKLYNAADSPVGTFAEVEGEPGIYRVTAPLVRSKTTFSARFLADAVNAASTLSVSVQPKVALTISAPVWVRRYSAFTVGGSIKPAHHDAVVRIEVAKRGSDGVYRVTKRIWSKTSTTSVRKSISLPSGRWRLSLLHYDAGHAYSASRRVYITVK